MINIGGLIFGAIVGALGAALWAAIAYYGNLEIGYIAWGIGAAVGFAVSFGSDQKGTLPAIIAVVITIASLFAGKYATVSLDINDHISSVDFSDSDMVTQIAFAIAEEKEAAGEQVAWRNGTNYDSASAMADLPKDIRKLARDAWSNLSKEEKSEQKEARRQEWVESIGQVQDEIIVQNFLASFSFYDILFFGLGIFTAARLAYGGETNSDPASGSSDSLFGERTKINR